MDDRMQRAPAFLFEIARGAREFVEWLDEHIDEIREVAESTTQWPAARHRAVLRKPHPLHALQLHDRRRRRAEHDRQGDAGRLPLDPRAVPRHRPLLPRGQLRHRQEELADQHAAHARQARRGRGGHPRRAVPGGHDSSRRDVPARGLQPRRLHVRRQQQRRALANGITRCSSPPARTSPTSPSPPPPSPTPSSREWRATVLLPSRR